jgi:DNA-binding winged helix-turn-helix (wHTH) protein/tetratricopeptide (TPR) repeat protein
MSAPTGLRFGAFELDTSKGELRRRGDLVKLAAQPLKVLALLVRRAGEVVTRQEIKAHIWSGDTFVDFEQGLNFCIRQVREALGDTADAPRFIETLPRRGYRFLMPVISAAPESSAKVTRLIVLPFTMLRPDPETEFLAFSLPDALTASLAGFESLVVRSTSAAARFVGAAADPKHVASEADVDVIVTGTLLRSGGEVRVTTQVTDASSGAVLWSNTAQVPVSGVFTVQDALTQRLIASLAAPLSVRDQQMMRTRDVPASAEAYEYFLRGNQLSYEPRQWSVARDLYLRCVEEDPRFAPAWARLGRMHHVMGKYLETGTHEMIEQGEAALRRALQLNPDLPMAHKFLAQLDLDLGRAQDAMTRLIGRGPAVAADPEVFAGLVTACRGCGLLDASAAAHVRALALEPKIRTSVGHTWFLQGDHARVAGIGIVPGYPYIVALSMAELGRVAEALAGLRELESKVPARVRDFVTAARTLLEGNTADSHAAILRVTSSGFYDPEAFVYLARHLAHLDDRDAALALLERAIDGGFACLSPLERDPWLDPLRDRPAFTALLRRVEALQRAAETAFVNLHGPQFLGVAAPAASAAPAPAAASAASTASATAR